MIEWMPRKNPLQPHKERMFRVADSILRDRNLARAAVNEAMREYAKRFSKTVFPVSLEVQASILAKGAALSILEHSKGKGPKHIEYWSYTKCDFNTPHLEQMEETDALMLCLGPDVDVLLMGIYGKKQPPAVAEFLGISEWQARIAYQTAWEALQELLSDEDAPGKLPDAGVCLQAIEQMRKRIAAYMPPERQEEPEKQADVHPVKKKVQQKPAVNEPPPLAQQTEGGGEPALHPSLQAEAEQETGEAAAVEPLMQQPEAEHAAGIQPESAASEAEDPQQKQAAGEKAFVQQAETEPVVVPQVENPQIEAFSQQGASTDSQQAKADAEPAEKMEKPQQKVVKKGKPKMRRRWMWAAFAFACFDIGILALAFGIFGWSSLFVKESGNPAFVDHGGSAQYVVRPGTNTVSDTFYLLAGLPDGFYLTEHLRADNAAYLYYADDAGGVVAFTQQVAEQPVTGFDSSRPDVHETVIQGHKAALHSDGGMQEILWYNGALCYTVSTTLPEEEAIAIAESAALATGLPALQHVPLEALPEGYTRRLAFESGDVLLEDGYAPYNLDSLYAFEKAYQAGEDASVRISRFYADDSVRIFDLQTSSGRLYYTQDARRDRNAVQPWERGEACEGMALVQENGQHVLQLKTGQSEEPLSIPLG